MEFEGAIKNIIFENFDNGFRIISLETTDGDIVAAGNIPMVTVGDYLKIEGEFVYHKKYGEQIQVNFAEKTVGKSLISIERYLVSRNFPHIGKKMASRIVERFGENTLDILRDNPARLMEVTGIGKKSYDDIKVALEDEGESQEIFMFLQELGVTSAQAQRILSQYGGETKRIITENPYRLVEDIWGIGFQSADTIALKSDIPKDSPFRIKACFTYFLENEAMKNGNCYMDYDFTINKVSQMLDISTEVLESHITKLIIDRTIVVDYVNDKKTMYAPYYYESELMVAGKIAKFLAREKEKIDVDIDEFIKKEKENISLAKEQREAIELACNENMLVITGGPGTGKTTIIKHIVDIYKEQGLEVILAAPTGRAAKRLEQSCDYKAMTIHRLLGYKPMEDKRIMRFDHDEDNPLLSDLIIIDESSMIDLQLCENLLKGICEDSRIIFVGDVDQLPSVGAGNVLKDLIGSKLIPTIKLNRIFRQGKDSNIVINAHKINRGEFPILNEKDKDFFFISEPNSQATRDRVLELVAKRLPEYYGYKGVEEIEVLTPMKKGNIGTIELNQSLQEVLNPKTPNKEELQYGDRLFREKDRIMQMKNNYTKEYITYDGQTGQGVFNGDFGIIHSIDSYAKTMDILFEDGRKAKYSAGEMDEISLAYGITIHKSQGSEFPAVVIPLGAGPYMLMTRNLIYTAITRAKELVVMVGELKYLKDMIGNNYIAKRNSSLSKRIVEYTNTYRGIIDEI